VVLSGEGTPEIYVATPRAGARAQDALGCGQIVALLFTGRVAAGVASEPGPQLYVLPVSGECHASDESVSSYCADRWSRANPNKIAFTMMEGSTTRSRCWIVHGSERESFSAPFDGIEPCWLPDGRHGGYTARTSSESRICILDTETGKSVPISPSSFGSTMQANVWAALSVRAGRADL